MEVKAKNVSRGDEINIVSDNEKIIADIILNELCSLDEVTDAVANYSSEYDFFFKDPDKMSKYIVTSASYQTNKVIHVVNINTLYDGIHTFYY